MDADMDADVKILDITETPATPDATGTSDDAVGIIVWIGGPITAGGGAGSDVDRMSTLVSAQLGLTEKNYASVTAKVSDGLVTRCYAARDDTSYNHADVAYVVIAGGLEDPISALPAVIYKARDAANECRKAFPQARIIWAASPGSLAGMSDTRLADTVTVTAAILGQARATDCLAIDMRKVLGTDHDLQSTGILPNAEGHARLAETLHAAIIEDRGEPVDTPVTTLVRRYGVSGDWLGRQVQMVQRREAEKREANRPTGTELGRVTQKLDDLTQAQGVQQVLLEQQHGGLNEYQQELDEHQQELEAQQKSLKSTQDAIKAAQEQLKKVVSDQDDQASALKTLTESLQRTDAKIDTIQSTFVETQQKLDNRIDQLVERVQRLENGTSA